MAHHETDGDYYVELWKERTRRIRRVAQLLGVVLLLVIIDASSRNETRLLYDEKVRLVLHDFVGKYREPVIAWHRTRGVPNAEIRFKGKSACSWEPPAGYLRDCDVPVLSEFLHEHLPLMRMEETVDFLGYRLPQILYWLAMLGMPWVLLTMILVDAHGLREILRLIKAAPNPMARSAFMFPRVTDRQTEQWKSYARGLSLCALLFVLSSLIHVIGVESQWFPVVEGTLLVDPSGTALTVKDGKATFEGIGGSWALVVLYCAVDLGLSLAIGRHLVGREGMVLVVRELKTRFRERRDVRR
jgi:hypothetical protein